MLRVSCICFIFCGMFTVTASAENPFSFLISKKEAEAATTATSQTNTPARKPRNVVIVTANHRNIAEEKITRSVTVITEEQMDRQKIDTVAEAVRQVPGVTLRNQGGLGRNTSLQIRGGLSRQTLVLFDGVQSINSPTVGSADLGSLFNTGIEQIEIIRGGSGVLHSSRAQAGVINIITKRGKGAPEIGVIGEFGSNRTFRETAAVSGSFSEFSSLSLDEIYYAFSATRVDSGGIGLQNDFANTYFTARLGADINEHINFDFVSRMYDASVGLDDITFPGFEPVGIENSVQKDQLLTLKPEVNLNYGWWEGKLAFSENFQNQYSRGPFYESRNKIDTKRFDFINNIYIPEVGPLVDTITFGYDYTRERANIEDILFGGKAINSISLHGFYLQNESVFYERFTVVEGVRIIDHKLFGTDHVWSFSTAYRHLETNTKLIASFDQSFGAPTLNDLFSPFGGNTNLLPEKGKHYEIGMQQDLLDEKLSLHTSYFFTEYKDLIKFIQTGPFSFNLLNAQAAIIHGVENEIAYYPLENLALKANYTFIFSQDKSVIDDKQLQLTPVHTANFLVDWTVTERWHVNFDITATSPVRQDSVPYKPNGYFKADLTTSYDISKNAQVYARIENLFDDTYQTNPGFPEPGFQIFIGTKIKFGGK